MEAIRQCDRCEGDYYRFVFSTTSLYENTPTVYYVVCERCHMRGPEELSEEEAIISWNYRPFEETAIRVVAETLYKGNGSPNEYVISWAKSLLGLL